MWELLLVLHTVSAQVAFVTTFAGGSATGYVDGVGSNAEFKQPAAISSFSTAAGVFYVADTFNADVRAVTPTGSVTTVAGEGFPGLADGSGTNAQFGFFGGIAADPLGTVIIGDSDNNKIRYIDPTGSVTTLAGGGGGQVSGSVDGYGTVALFANPRGITITETGFANGYIFVADSNNHKVRAIAILDPERTCLVSTIAGGGQDGVSFGSADGIGTGALFRNPEAFAFSENSSHLYLSDFFYGKVRVLYCPSLPCSVTTLVGGGSDGQTSGVVDGIGTNALFAGPSGLALGAGGLLYVADAGSNRIRSINLATSLVTTIAGRYSSGIGLVDGVGTNALFSYPTGISVDATGSLIVVDSDNSALRRIIISSVTLSPSITPTVSVSPTPSLTALATSTPTPSLIPVSPNPPPAKTPIGTYVGIFVGGAVCGALVLFFARSGVGALSTCVRPKSSARSTPTFAANGFVGGEVPLLSVSDSGALEIN